MKYHLLTVGLMAAAFALGTLVPNGDSPVSSTLEPSVVPERVVPPVADLPSEVRLTAPGTAHRTPVATVDDDDLVQAIALAESERDRYAALIASDSYPAMLLRMEKAEGAANVLHARIAHLERELARANLDPSTPYGHFALLPEVAEADTRTLQQVQALLEDFPVILAPHEAEWLIARHKSKDWRDWPGHGTTETVIAYLNPDRLAAELPAKRVADLVAYYADEPWVFPQR